MTRFRLALTGLLALGCLAPAHAQQARVVTDCTGASLRAGDGTGLMVDQAGKLCTAGAGGGGASTVTGSQEQDVRASASLNVATLNAAVTIPINGQAAVGFTFTGLAASGAVLTYEQSNDGGTTWTGVNALNTGTGVPEATRTTDGQIRVLAADHTHVRVRVSTAGTGTVTVASNVSVRAFGGAITSPLPPGSNAIGSVVLGAGAAQVGTIGNTAFGISGTLPAFAATPTFNLGTLNGAATAANQNVTAAGTSAANAQAVQGVTGGVPQNIAAASLPLPAGAAQDGTDPASPAVVNDGAGIRGWLATIARLNKLGSAPKATSASVTPATDLANIEPAGAPITGATMPAGGAGVTGWLSAVWNQLGVANARARIYAPTAVNASLASGGGSATPERTTGAVVGGADGPFANYNVSAVASTTGTLNILGRTTAGGSNIPVASYSTAANVPTNVSVKVLYPIYIAQFVNSSGAAATGVYLADGFSAN